MDQPISLFVRYFSRPRPRWFTIKYSLILLLLPFAAVYLDGNLDRFLNQTEWRLFLLAPTIIIFIWLVPTGTAVTLYYTWISIGNWVSCPLRSML
jgi:hypothetical protein